MNELIKKCLEKLKGILYGVFITANNELILDRKTNVYFRLDDIKTELDFDSKILAWLVRPACKGLTKKQHQFFANVLNTYFNQSWTYEDLSLIYTKLGCYANPDLRKEFILSGFNLDLLRTNL